MARIINEPSQTVDDVFLGLAEQVKLPFIQVLHASEMLEDADNKTAAEARQTIRLASRSALHLIDGYLLSVRLQREAQLPLEPVSISSLLYDTAEALNESAAAHNCEIELVVGGKYGPVMSNASALSAALVNIGHSLIESIPAETKRSNRVIKLAVRRTSGGISTGVFTTSDGLTSKLLERARQLQGGSHQPMGDFLADNAAGIFVADRLFTSLDARMRVARMQGQSGLAATLLPSRQLSLV